MRRARRLWVAFLQPRAQLRFNVVMAAIWLVAFWPGMTVWSEALQFLAFCSIYANFVGHLGGIAAAAGARKADPEDEL